MENIEKTLIELSQSLDISPSDFKRAQDRFLAIRNWLEKGEYESGYSPHIYLQGSFRLGTVVRPYFKDKDGDFDIDQVCELKPNHSVNPKVLKNDIGDRLKDDANYERMLDDEGKRCWTILYASEDNRPGFHIDVLPSLTATGGAQYRIDITHKDHSTYSWSKSNPNGYYLWFKSKNQFTDQYKTQEKQRIFQSNIGLYNSSIDVPTQLLRSSLQRAIQIMKRHRDIHFLDKDHKPISIIITTITGHVSSNSGICNTINEFTNYCWTRYKDWLRDGYLERDGILDFHNGLWVVPNPVDAGLYEDDIENFADKWNLDDSLPKAFFEWVRQLQRDIDRFEKSGVSNDLNLRVKEAGIGVPFAQSLQQKVQSEIDTGVGDNYNLLQLIHLGIEGKIDWEFVKKAAQNEYDVADTQDNKDVAIVNFYQVVRHRGIPLGDKAIQDVNGVLERHQNSSRYVMCCHLLLGTATYDMVRQCIADEGDENILSWPIIRLFDFPDAQEIVQRTQM